MLGLKFVEYAIPGKKIKRKASKEVEKMNLLSSSIYMHLKTNSIKHMQSLILGVCGSQHISVFGDIFQFYNKF
jgi:hypothetical protein